MTIKSLAWIDDGHYADGPARGGQRPRARGEPTAASPGQGVRDLYGVVMGALKPWHILIMLFCLIVVAGGATALVAIIRATNKKNGTGDS
jgi:hypothetical protein